MTRTEEQLEWAEWYGKESERAYDELTELQKLELTQYQNGTNKS